MISGEDTNQGRALPVISFFSTWLLATILVGSALVLGGARTWVLIPIYAGIAGLIVLQIVRCVCSESSSVFRFDGADGFAVLFVIYAFIRYQAAPVEYGARLELLNILSCATVFWVARYGLARSSHGAFLLWALGLAGAGLAMYAFYMKAHPEIVPLDPQLHLHYFPRLTGTFGCPNHLGAFLVMATAAALGLAMFLRGVWPARILFFYSAAVMIVAVGFTLSRGSWIGLFFATLAIVIFSMRHSSLTWYWVLGFFVAGLIGAVMVLWQTPMFHERWNEVAQHVQNGTLRHYVRVQLALDALKIWHDHFWLGSGPATFLYEHQRYQEVSYPTLAIYTHNDYLNLLADYGLVGGLLALGFILSVSIGLSRHVDSRAPWSHRALLCAGAAAWWALLVHSLVDFNLHIPACALTLFTLIGLGLRRRDGTGPLLPYDFRGTIRVVHVAILLAILAAFSVGAWRVAQGFGPYWTAFSQFPSRQPEASDWVKPFPEMAALLQESAARDPQFSDAAAALGDLYRVQAARAEMLDQQQMLGAESLAWYQRAHRTNPLDDGLLMKMGLIYDLLDRKTEAFLCYRLSTENQPHNGYFQTALATHFLQRGEKEQAIATYEKATRCAYGGEEAGKALKILRQPEPDPFHHPPTLP